MAAGAVRSRLVLPTRLLVALALVLSLLPALGSAAHAAVGTPSGLSTSGGGSATPTLQWQRVASATRYDVEVSASSSFTPTLFTRSTTNRMIVPTVVLPEGTVHWRVRAVDVSGTSAWASATHTVTAPNAPLPQTPSNTVATVLGQPSDPPLLSWKGVSGATGYQVEVDATAEGATSADFVDASSYSTKSTSFVVPDPKADGTYFWRVRAQLSNGLYTAFSAPWRYKIGQLLAVDNAYPENNDAGAIQDVYLEWDAVPGARTYDLQVSADDQFNTIIDSKIGIKSTRYSPAVTYDNDQYYWRVRARNNLGETFDWSHPKIEIYNFQRNWPEQPVPVHPADSLSTIGDDLYLEWKPVRRATRYQLDLGTDPNFSKPGPLGTYQTCFTASTTYTPGDLSQPGISGDKCMASQGAVTYWRVRALDDPKGVEGIYSPIRKFVYSSGAARQIAPANGATVTSPLLTWDAMADVERYRVTLRDPSGFTRTYDTYSLNWSPTGMVPLASGTYWWSVQGMDGDGRLSPRYAEWSFVLGPVAGTGSTPVVQNPPAGLRAPTLRWSPVTNAAYYRVDIGIAGSGFYLGSAEAPILNVAHPYPVATDPSARFLVPGNYEWRVRAFSKANALLSSDDSGTFTITGLQGVGGQRIALTGSGLDAGTVCDRSLDAPLNSGKCPDVPATPVLDWSPVPGAAFYKVYLAQDRELTNRIFDDKIPATGNTRWTLRDDVTVRPSALPDTQAGQAYFWYIRPCKSETVCAPDPVSTAGAAGHAFGKASPAVGGLTVTPSATKVENQAVFTWDDYIVSNLAKPYTPTGEKSWQTAKHYRIQVATSTSFATLVDNQLVDQATYTAWDRTYPEGSYWWRVQAVDAQNNGLTWSTPIPFVKQSPAPVLSAPINDSRIPGQSAFKWLPTNFAGSYMLEVYKNNDTNWSPTNRVVSFTGKQVAYANSTPLPANALPYVWRVARLDADNRPGQWSTTGRFYSTGAAPGLTTPSAGALMSGQSPFFAWSPVVGAVTYRFERRAKGSSTLAENITTSATSWASLQTIASGVSEWRVIALDVTGAPLGESPWQPFTVDNEKGRFTAVSPARVLDTRSGLGINFPRKLGPGQNLTFRVPDLAPGTTAVVLNVTAVNPSAGSYLTVWPFGQTRPTASNVNFAKGATVPNQVIVKVGTNNQVNIYNATGSVDVLADLAGYYAPDLGAAFTAVAPKRVLDTRSALGTPSTSKVGAGREIVLDVTDLPADAKAVTLNVTANQPTASSYVTVWPADGTRPNASSLNFKAGQTVPNLVTVAVSADGRVRLWNASGSTHLFADLAGWFSGDTGGTYSSVNPQRVLDTRLGTGAPKAKLGPAPATLTLTVPGLPADATAVALNVTATGPTKSGWLTVYPGNVGRPAASNLNFVAGQTVANMVVVKVAPGGKVTFSNAAGSVDVIADLAGYYTG
ncbi:MULTISPECIES: hypothetical protein [unclassified Knoellia]|uniref:hypothetical protein n=1 Tax=Knoellia altitudinis TaxID=3404795 RepID=UPI0036170F9A